MGLNDGMYTYLVFCLGAELDMSGIYGVIGFGTHIHGE